MVNKALAAFGSLAAATALSYAVSIPVWLNMCLHTLVPVYLGSLNSRKLSIYCAEPATGDVKPMDTNEAIKFPLIASSVLLTLYICIKYINPDLVNVLLTLYFVILGIFCLKTVLYDEFVMNNLFVSEFKFQRVYKMPQLLKSIPYFPQDPLEVELTKPDLVAYGIAVPLGLLYYCTKYWVLTNVFGLAFSVHAIENMSLGSFKIGYGLLLGLLVYDVFFVFGTDVMLTVAKGIDGPIKLLFPKGDGTFSMIGLGDIILPGIFVALCSRFDLFQQHKKDQKDQQTYFSTGLLGYFLGLALTILVMNVMQKEQPALLYLVPACLLATTLTAAWKNDFKALWAYVEE